MAWGNQYRSAGGGGEGMEQINVLLTVILIGVVAYVAFRPGNQTAKIIGSIGGASTQLTRTLSGQYQGGGY